MPINWILGHKPQHNETHIILIPKVKNRKKILEYQPINLSNVISRIASKVLTNRLKVVLPTIIGVHSCLIGL